MTKERPTKEQLPVLDFIRLFIEEYGYSPSYREIMAALNYSSTSAVAEHIDHLVENGFLRKVPGKRRCLEVVSGDIYAPARELVAKKLAEFKRTGQVREASTLRQALTLLFE